MKTLSYFFILVSLLGVISACGSGNENNTENSYKSLSRHIVFGGRVGGVCEGKGLCRTFSASEPIPNEAVLVNIALDSQKRDTLIFSFSMNELEAKQHEQYSFFLPPNDQYSFDAPVLLTVPFYAALPLKPNAKILPTSFHTIERIPQQNGDILVKLRILYSHT